MEINVGDNVKIKRGSRPTPLSKYESKIKTINSIPYPIQSDIDTNSIFLNKCKKYFRIDLNFKFVPSIKGDLLMTSSCDIGNVVILDFQEAFIDDKFFNLEVSKQISKSYLKYWLIKNKNDISNLGYGTTIKVLYIEPFKQYLKTKFLPALKTQQAIINIIEPFEKLKNKINNKLHYLKDITLICINNFNLNKKFSLNNFVNFQGFSFKSNDFIPNNGKYIIYKISNITNSKQNTSYTNNLISSCLLTEGDVVTGLSGTIGTSDVILESDKFLLNQRLLAIKTNYPLLIKLIIENNKNILEKKSTGSVQMNITKNDVLNIKYDSNLNNVFNNLISKLYINYSKKIILINNAIKLLIDLYIF